MTPNWTEAAKPVLRQALQDVSDGLEESRIRELLAPFNTSAEGFVAQGIASLMPPSAVANVLAGELVKAIEADQAPVIAAFGSVEGAAMAILRTEIAAVIASLAPPTRNAADANNAPGGGPAL